MAKEGTFNLAGRLYVGVSGRFGRGSLSCRLLGGFGGGRSLSHRFSLSAADAADVKNQKK